MKLKSVKLDRDINAETIKYERLLNDALQRREGGETTQAIFDSAANESGSMPLPKHYDTLLGKINKGDEGEVLGAIFDGIDVYMHEHGMAPSPDLIEAAVQQGLAAFDPKDVKGKALFDSASSNAHDQQSLQPNRAITAIIRTLAEAFPCAGYLPVDIGSNQSKLIIASTLAGSNFGGYAVNDSLEGLGLGEAYSLASRIATLVNTSGTWAVQFYTRNLATGEPNTASTAVAIYRGRTQIYVNGLPAGADVTSSNATGSTSQITGGFTLAGVSYAVTGTITLATGAVSCTFSPALPATTSLNGVTVTTVVQAKAIIDYDAQPALIPLVSVLAQSYELYATESRIYTSNAFGSAQQLRNEAGVDPEALATAKFRDQHTMERHYQSLRQARQIGLNNQAAMNFNFSNRGTQLIRAQIMQDMSAHLGRISQQMAIDTQDHGVTHLYVGNFMAAVMEGCSLDIFKPSGVPKRASVYRLGRLFGTYEVYYSPKGPVEAADGSSSEVICIGVSSQTARNPFIFGDAVPPTLLPLATNADFKRQAGMYARDYNEVNPHAISAKGCGLLTVTNMI